MFKFAFLAAGVILLTLSFLSGVNGLSKGQIHNHFKDIRDKSTTSGSTQFAGVKLLDGNGITIYENLKAFPETTPTHVEAYFLNDGTFLSNLARAHHLFIYTKNSPCVSSRAGNRAGRISCALQIIDLAKRRNDVKVYVGFQTWYGKGNRFAPSSTRETEFRAEACYKKPTNLSYYYMHKKNSFQTISCARGGRGRRGRGRGGRG